MLTGPQDTRCIEPLSTNRLAYHGRLRPRRTTHLLPTIRFHPTLFRPSPLRLHLRPRSSRLNLAPHHPLPYVALRRRRATSQQLSPIQQRSFRSSPTARRPARRPFLLDLDISPKRECIGILPAASRSDELVRHSHAHGHTHRNRRYHGCYSLVHLQRERYVLRCGTDEAHARTCRLSSCAVLCWIRHHGYLQQSRKRIFRQCCC